MAPSLLVRGSDQRRSSPASSPSKLALAFSIPPGYSFCMSIYSCPKPLHFPESHLFGCHLCFGFWLRSPPFALPVKKHHPLRGARVTRSTYPALSLILTPDLNAPPSSTRKKSMVWINMNFNPTSGQRCNPRLQTVRSETVVVRRIGPVSCHKLVSNKSNGPVSLLVQCSFHAPCRRCCLGFFYVFF